MFRDRTEAGVELARAVERLVLERSWSIDDVVVVRKVGWKFDPEVGVGPVSDDVVGELLMKSRDS